MSEILIVSKTKMANNRVCVGGIDIENKMSVRLLDRTGYHESADTCPFNIREIWDIQYSKHNQRPLPHSEDIRVISRNKSNKQKSEMPMLDLLNEMSFYVCRGAIRNTFEGKLKRTDLGAFYISKDAVPNNSTCFWVSDKELRRSDYNGKVRYSCYILNQNPLFFNSTTKSYSIEQFKRDVGVNTLRVLQNPKTGKYFFVYGAEIGKVSNILVKDILAGGTDPNKDIMVSITSEMDPKTNTMKPVALLHYAGIAATTNDNRYTIPYVGLKENPPEIIPQGTLLRLSLAHWWTPEDADTEERCYLQLSGWYH